MNAIRFGGRLLVGGIFAASLVTGTALANHGTPGQAGQTKVSIYDNTHNGWNVATNDPVTGGADPVIGFVNFRPTVPGDPTNIKVVVALKDGAPNCTYNIELVTTGANTSSGLAPDGFHTGNINIIGSMTTNGNGKGNSGSLTVDTTTLVNVAPSGGSTYAHVDIEASGICTENDSTPVDFNEYGASAVAEADRIHWQQP